MKIADPANIYFFKVNNKVNRKDIRTTSWRQWRRSDVFIVNFEHISHFFLLFILLTLNIEI